MGNLLGDVLGSGKASEKLLDVIQKGIGQLYDHSFGPNLEARKIKIISLAEDEAEHKKIIKQTETLLEADKIAQRAGKRLLVREIRRQNNIERNITLTALELNSAMEVSEKPVDTGWATRFFDIVQDITENEIQKIWAKILAGEIRKPGSFSLRTLEILRNITKEEAQIFAEKVCPLVFNSLMIVKINNKAGLDNFGLSFGNIIQMRDAGLIINGDSIIQKYKEIKDKNFILNLKKERLILKSTNDEYKLPVYILSNAGQELYNIQNCIINKKYFEEVKSNLKINGFIDPDEIIKDEQKNASV